MTSRSDPLKEEQERPSSATTMQSEPEARSSKDGESASKKEAKVSPYLPIVISVLSLIVASSALYYSQLRPAALMFSMGRVFELYYPRDGGFGMYIPVTVVNKSPNTGAVLQCSVVLSREDSEDQYYFGWIAYGVRGPDGWEGQPVEHPIVVPGRSTVSNTIWYVWRPWTEPAIILKEGEYRVRLLALVDGEEEPRVVADRRFFLPKKFTDILNERRVRHNPQTIILTWHEKLPENKVLSDEDRSKIEGLSGN